MTAAQRRLALLTLADGRALPAGTVAAEAGPSAAAGLDALVAEGLAEVLASGPYRYFRLTASGVAAAVAARRTEPGFAVRSLREGSPAYAVRLARRCYGHPAGRFGVAVTDALRRLGVVDGPSGDVDLATVAVRGRRLAGGVVDADAYRLTDSGPQTLAALGVRVPTGLGEVRCCVDWTEQRHHAAGPLGAALLDAFSAAGWVEPSPTPRALVVTPAGRAALADRLGLPWPPPARGGGRGSA